MTPKYINTAGVMTRIKFEAPLNFPPRFQIRGAVTNPTFCLISTCDRGGVGTIRLGNHQLRLMITFAHYMYVQGSAKMLRPGLVNIVLAAAYHFCLDLPAAFTQPA